MRTNTSKFILEYLDRATQATAKELVDHLGLSPRAIFQQLKKLREAGSVQRTGLPPKVFYFRAASKVQAAADRLDSGTEKTIEQNYLFVSPTGEMEEGFKGFSRWCRAQGLDVKKTAGEYIRTLKKYERFRKEGLIGGMHKMKTTFDQVSLDQLYYVDFYSIERFGKTKLGQLLLYAKQSQNRALIKRLSETIKPAVQFLIKKYHIDAVGFIPPTVKREVQLIRELEKNLKLPVRTLSIVKVRSPLIIPQKTLTKLADRIENARKTIIVREEGRYKNILLIDDAVGSGATLNETGFQIRRKKLCSGKIIGLSITGSFKGFDVISEV